MLEVTRSATIRKPRGMDTKQSYVKTLRFKNTKECRIKPRLQRSLISHNGKGFSFYPTCKCTLAGNYKWLRWELHSSIVKRNDVSFQKSFPYLLCNDRGFCFILRFIEQLQSSGTLRNYSNWTYHKQICVNWIILKLITNYKNPLHKC